MTIVTSLATYVVGWASRGGTRAISIVDGSTSCHGKILFLRMGEPMVYAGPGDMLCITLPVVFIARRQFQGISVPELRTKEMTDGATVELLESLNLAESAGFAM